MKNTFGNLLQITLFGESVTCVHVKELGKAELIETPLELLKTKLGG